MKLHHSNHGLTFRAMFLALFLAMPLLVAGCASSGGAADRTANEDPETLCRAAIADVSKLCAGDGADSSACERAKARAAQHCLPD